MIRGVDIVVACIFTQGKRKIKGHQNKIDTKNSNTELSRNDFIETR